MGLAESSRAWWQSLVCRARDAWPWVRYPLAIWAVSRVALFGLSAMSLRLVPRLITFPNRRLEALRDWPALDGLCRWDCGKYAKIAENGYHEYVAAPFFPLFPALGRLVSEVTGLSIHVSLILVANLGALGAYLIVYQLVESLHGEAAARTTVVLLAFSPFAFYQGVAYPESLMVAFSAGAIALAYRERYVASGVVVGLGLLARHIAAFAALPLLWLLWQRRLPSGRRTVWSLSGLSLLAPLVALAGFSLWLHVELDDPLAWWHARSVGWQGMAWQSVFHLFVQPETRLFVNFAFSLVIGAGAFLLLRRRRWWPLAVFSVPLMLFLWAMGLTALGRYSASCWPALVPFGVWLSERPSWQAPVFALSGVGWGVFTYLYVHQGPFY